MTAVIIVSVFITSILSGIFGMSGGLILMGVLSALLSVPAAMIAHGYAQFWANGIRTLNLRTHIYWPSLPPYILGAAAGWLVLKLLISVPDKAILFLLMGSVPFIALPFRKIKMDFQLKSHALLCGFAVSTLQLLAGVAGPLLDVFFIKTHLTRHQIVATKAITQTMGHAMKIVFYWEIFMAQNSHELGYWFYGLAVPSALAGTRIGVIILDKMTDKQFLKWTQWIVMGLGTFYLIRGFTLLYQS